jgi:hypothetical protein
VRRTENNCRQKHNIQWKHVMEEDDRSLLFLQL